MYDELNQRAAEATDKFDDVESIIKNFLDEIEDEEEDIEMEFIPEGIEWFDLMGYWEI
jgi:hypothetical protein